MPCVTQETSENSHGNGHLFVCQRMSTNLCLNNMWFLLWLSVALGQTQNCSSVDLTLKDGVCKRNNCAPGTFGTQDGCSACAVGLTSDTGSFECWCPPLSYLKDGRQCILCTNGTTADIKATSCSACPLGSALQTLS